MRIYEEPYRAAGMTTSRKKPLPRAQSTVSGASAFRTAQRTAFRTRMQRDDTRFLSNYLEVAHTPDTIEKERETTEAGGRLTSLS